MANLNAFTHTYFSWFLFNNNSSKRRCNPWCVSVLFRHYISNFRNFMTFLGCKSFTSERVWAERRAIEKIQVKHSMFFHKTKNERHLRSNKSFQIIYKSYSFQLQQGRVMSNIIACLSSLSSVSNSERIGKGKNFSLASTLVNLSLGTSLLNKSHSVS